jgi:hypothetical protein
MEMITDMSSKYTIADAVRMVGHLLEHHPTTEYWAHTKDGHPTLPNNPHASCWCLFGACEVVGAKLKLNYNSLAETVCSVLNIAPAGISWDNHPDKASVCKKLQEYKG